MTNRERELIAASIRVGVRLEFALEGKPAWSWLDGNGNIRPGMSRPKVRFAAPWAEDPRTLNIMLSRLDTCITNERAGR